jgi:hypothetical protein
LWACFTDLYVPNQIKPNHPLYMITTNRQAGAKPTIKAMVIDVVKQRQEEAAAAAAATAQQVRSRSSNDRKVICPYPAPSFLPSFLPSHNIKQTFAGSGGGRGGGGGAGA